jgi:phosphohistidine phosphatase SixA
MRTLLVMRHAKSDWGAAYGIDHERPWQVGESKRPAAWDVS